MKSDDKETERANSLSRHEYYICRNILGVTSNPHVTFLAHVNSIVTRASSCINILKALAGTNWGQKKETARFTYIFLKSDTFSCMLLPFGSLTAHHDWFRNSKLSKTMPSTMVRLDQLD